MKEVQIQIINITSGIKEKIRMLVILLKIKSSYLVYKKQQLLVMVLMKIMMLQALTIRESILQLHSVKRKEQMLEDNGGFALHITMILSELIWSKRQVQFITHVV